MVLYLAIIQWRKRVRRLILAIVVPVFSLIALVSCENLLGEESEGPQTGMTGFALSEVYASDSDPVASAESIGAEAYSILRITGPSSYSIIVATAADGSFSVSGLSAGTYTVTPLYIDSSYAETVTVSAGAIATVELFLPRSEVEAYIPNTRDNRGTGLGEFANRRPLDWSVDRAEHAETLDTSGYLPAYGVIPSTLAVDGWANDQHLWGYQVDDVVTPTTARGMA